MSSSDKGFVTAIQDPFLYLAATVVNILERVWQLILLPINMTIDLFDSTTP